MSEYSKYISKELRDRLDRFNPDQEARDMMWDFIQCRNLYDKMVHIGHEKSQETKEYMIAFGSGDLERVREVLIKYNSSKVVA